VEEAIQKIAVISFFIIGLSHIFQPLLWTKFFIAIREKEETGAFINGFIHFPLGALIAAFHNVWQGIPIILTFIGYGLVLKGLICFVFPKLALKSLARVSPEKSWEMVVAGIILIGISGLILYSLITK
jgi:uncharacterized protein YjeT (DUF2065 family)